MMGREVISGDDEVRQAGSYCIRERCQPSQAVVGVSSPHNAGCAQRMPGRADSFHRASCIRESHRQPGSREPARRRGNQNCWFHLYLSLRIKTVASGDVAEKSKYRKKPQSLVECCSDAEMIC